MNLFTFKTNVNQIDNTPYPFVYYKGVLATKPSLILFYQNKELTIVHNKEKFKLNMPEHTALEFLEELNQNLPKPSYSQIPSKNLHYKYGLIGFFSFEFGLKLQKNNLDPNKLKEQKIPDFYFILPTQIDILDQDLNSTENYTILNEKAVLTTPSNHLTKDINLGPEFKSNLTKNQYLKTLEKLKQLFIEGETYQVNFAQRWIGHTPLLGPTIFNRLNQINPSPHQAILHTADFSLISNSPESLFIKTKNKLQTYPIKGTLPKNQDPQILLNSAKDQAELEMIVDLERNDLGKIAKPGTVKVTKHRYLESYSNVHHTLSEISCTLQPKTKFSQIIQSIFPGGSVTGCPKFRTCQYIHDLEPNLREYYCGSLGYLDTSGNAQFNILIRTILTTNQETVFHSGGGITIQSNPQEEYQETLIKAENLTKVLSQ